MEPNWAVEIICRVDFGWVGVTIVLWFIIEGLRAADVWVVVSFVAMEGNITAVVLSTELFWNWCDKSWSATVGYLFWLFLGRYDVGIILLSHIWSRSIFGGYR